MGIYEELQARGLIAQVTNEEEIREMVNTGKARFYIGFDCTADSLTAGHFMALTLMKRLQQAGNQPIALIGGGTTMIGDPSGRTDMRKMLTREDINHNAECFKRQMEKFIEFGEGKAIMVNNADWLLDLNYVDVLREVGACFSVNNMLRAECYKQRMEKGLSFFEFNYMIMQSYDFYYLFQHYDCNMQFGGDDQWSNMLGGTELIRKKLRLARPEQDQPLRVLSVLAQRGRRGRDEVHPHAHLPPARGNRSHGKMGRCPHQREEGDPRHGAHHARARRRGGRKGPRRRPRALLRRRGRQQHAHHGAD